MFLLYLLILFIDVSLWSTLYLK